MYEMLYQDNVHHAAYGSKGNYSTSSGGKLLSSTLMWSWFLFFAVFLSL